MYICILTYIWSRYIYIYVKHIRVFMCMRNGVIELKSLEKEIAEWPSVKRELVPSFGCIIVPAHVIMQWPLACFEDSQIFIQKSCFWEDPAEHHVPSISAWPHQKLLLRFAVPVPLLLLLFRVVLVPSAAPHQQGVACLQQHGPRGSDCCSLEEGTETRSTLFWFLTFAFKMLSSKTATVSSLTLYIGIDNRKHNCAILIPCSCLLTDTIQSTCTTAV